MPDAPDRVWRDGRNQSGPVFWEGTQPPSSQFVTEYIRKDLVDAMVAAVDANAREESAQIAEPLPQNGSNAKGGLWWRRREKIAADIRARGQQ